LFALLLNIFTSLDCGPTEISKIVNLLMFYSFLSTKLNVMPSPLSMKYQANHIPNPLLLHLSPLLKRLSSSSIIRVIIIKAILQFDQVLKFRSADTAFATLVSYVRMLGSVVCQEAFVGMEPEKAQPALDCHFEI